MNGPDHYAEAERLLRKAPDHLLAGAPLTSTMRAQIMIETAAVHARLAQVALTLDIALTGGTGVADAHNWATAVESDG